MPSHVSSLETRHEVLGPWSLATSRRFWEGFAPSSLPSTGEQGELKAVFLNDSDWKRVEARITQDGASVRISLSGTGDLKSATAQTLRFLSLDIDGTEWPDVGLRDPVIADAQRRLPGFRPCGFYSPYEAAVWSVLSQRIQIRQAAAIAGRLSAEHGENGAFPAPAVLRGLGLDLPGRKSEYLDAVAEAALDGRLAGVRLRGMPPADALADVQQVVGLGPFAAELVVIRGANAPDVLPQNEKRLSAEIATLYGVERSAAEVSELWRPFRSWASVHLRALREERTHEIG